MGNAVYYAVKAIKNIVVNIFRHIAPPIVRYVVAHPIRTLFHVINGIIFLIHGVITGPLLGIARFCGAGIVGGSLAASVQSAMGVVQGGGTFATLQSTTTNGYDVARIFTVVRGAIIVSEVIWGACADKKNKSMPFWQRWESFSAMLNDGMYTK